MEYFTEEKQYENCMLKIVAPPTQTSPLPVLYLQDGDELLPLVMQSPLYKTHQDQIILASVQPLHRDDAYTPWPAPSPFKNAPSFVGNAPLFLQIMEEIKKYIDSAYNTARSPAQTVHMGISLSALFCLWAAYETPDFGTIAAVSPSVWYDGFISFAIESTLLPENASIFLSVGSGESNGRNPVLTETVNHMQTLYNHYATTLGTSHAALSLTDGGHTANTALRVENALQWIFDILK